MIPHRLPTLAFALTLALLGLGACRTTETGKDAEATEAATPGTKPYDPRVWDQVDEVPLGMFLAELDKSMRAWTNLTLTAQTSGDRKRANLLQKDLMKKVHKRQTELMDALAGGPPRSRAIAAGALGFSAAKEAQGPLIVALADRDGEVVQNAALALALLQDPETPFAPLLEVYQDHPFGQARANAAYAVRTLLEAGRAVDDDVRRAARHGLVDSEPFAQAQSALILAIAGDGESVPALRDLIAERSALVASAAIRSLVELARRDLKLLGPVARALVNGLGTAPAELAPAVRSALVQVSGHNFGNDTAAWNTWAQRLP